MISARRDRSELGMTNVQTMIQFAQMTEAVAKVRGRRECHPFCVQSKGRGLAKAAEDCSHSKTCGVQDGWRLPEKRLWLAGQMARTRPSLRDWIFATLDPALKRRAIFTS